jgi:hypothetical protein
MLMFYAALFCFCWSIPMHGTRIVIMSVTGLLFAFFWACVWTITESSEKWAVWLAGLPPPVARALRALHLSRFGHAAMLLRKHFWFCRTNDVGNEHELADPQDGVVVGEP